MSKLRRPRPQRQGMKSSPIPARTAPSQGEVSGEAPLADSVDHLAAPEAEFAPTAEGRMDFAQADVAAFEPVQSEPIEASAEPAMAREAHHEVHDGVHGVAAAPARFDAPAPAAQRLGAESYGTTVMNYFITEGEAFAAHLRALAGARTMGEVLRLQIGEFQRAANATLSCWGMLTVTASRTVALR